jgi:hypothetical protein
MALITDLSTVYNLVYQAGYTGQNSGSFGNQDLELLSGIVNQPLVSSGAFNSIVNVTTGFNTYFKMEGFNPITNQYENWHSMGTALMDPPSGHALTNISVIASWQDR